MVAKRSVRRLVVLGSEGFLGRYIVSHCRSAGIVVAGVDRANFQDLDQLGAAVRDRLFGQPEVIIHAAGLIGGSSDSAMDEAHVRSTEELLASVAAVAPRARVVVIGSAAEVGLPEPGDVRIPEREGGLPHGAYGRSKLEQSRVSLELGRRLGLDVLRVRVFNTLGPGQSSRLVGAAFVERLFETRAASGRVMTAADPASIRDFLDVRDVARCLIAIAESLSRDPERPPVNLCSEEGLSIAGLVGELLAASDAQVAVQWQPGALLPTRSVGECPTLRAILNGAPVRQISTLTSLRDMWHERVARADPV